MSILCIVMLHLYTIVLSYGQIIYSPNHVRSTPIHFSFFAPHRCSPGQIQPVGITMSTSQVMSFYQQKTWSNKPWHLRFTLCSLSSLLAAAQFLFGSSAQLQGQRAPCNLKIGELSSWRFHGVSTCFFFPIPKHPFLNGPPLLLTAIPLPPPPHHYLQSPGIAKSHWENL